MNHTPTAVHVAVLLVCTLWLSSCALPSQRAVFVPTTPQTAVEPAVETNPAEPAVPTRSTTPVPAPIPAAERLKSQAAAAHAAGDFARALALLERAQRIAPRDGIIYLDMATAHRADGRNALACQFARKGLSVPVSGEVADALEEQLDPC
ncbi:MAG: hypothetical protein AAF460_01050 [Pseudomonadota bacterium]